MCRSLTYVLVLALLCLALAGCVGSSLSVTSEQPCGESAYFTIANSGVTMLRVEGSVIRDDLGEHALPALRLAPGAMVRIWRGVGQDDEANYYLGQPTPTWRLGVWPPAVEHPPGWPWESRQLIFQSVSECAFGG